jgi:hypothetical protein
MRVFLLGVFLAAAGVPAPAFAIAVDVWANSFSVPVGGTVTMFADARPTSTDDEVRDALIQQTNWPGAFVSSLMTSDRDGRVDISFDAPGSVEGNGSGSYWWVYFGAFSYPNPPISFTYNTPGNYRIDYSYGASANIYPISTIFDSPEMNFLVTGMFFGGVREQGTGMGHFDITVAAVPEPSTWALMLLGFIFIAAAARSRRRSIA